MKLCFGQGRSRWAAVGCAKLDTFFSRHKKEAVAGLQARMRNTQAEAKKGVPMCQMSSWITMEKPKQVTQSAGSKTLHSDSRLLRSRLSWEVILHCRLVPKFLDSFILLATRSVSVCGVRPRCFSLLLRKRRRGGVRRVCVCMRVAEESQRAIWPTPTLVNTVKTFLSGWDTLKKTTDRRNEEMNTRIRQTHKLSVHAIVLPFFDTHNTWVSLVFLLLLPETRFHESDASQRNKKNSITQGTNNELELRFVWGSDTDVIGIGFLKNNIICIYI